MLNWRCFDIKFSFEDNNHCFKFLRNLQIILSLQKVENKKLYPETYVWKYLIWICGGLKLDIKSDNSGASFENRKILFPTFGFNCVSPVSTQYSTMKYLFDMNVTFCHTCHFSSLSPSLFFFSLFSSSLSPRPDTRAAQPTSDLRMCTELSSFDPRSRIQVCRWRPASPPHCN